MQVRKINDVWHLVFIDRGDEIEVELTDQNVKKLIDELNDAACLGASWPVYEPSNR